MVSSEEESFSEETKSANSEYGASWQQDSSEEDLMPSEGSSRSAYKRKRASSLPEKHKMKSAPTYPNVPVVNSSSFQNPWPWMYAQQMPMPPPWTMGAQPVVMPYNTPWTQVSPIPWDHLKKDYGGNDSQMKKGEKRVKAIKDVKNVSSVEQKVKAVRKVVKLKKEKRGNHLSLTEKLEQLQASQGNGQKKSRLVGSFAARMSTMEDRQKEMEENLSKTLEKIATFMDAISKFLPVLTEFVFDYTSIDNFTKMATECNLIPKSRN